MVFAPSVWGWGNGSSECAVTVQWSGQVTGSQHHHMAEMWLWILCLRASTRSSLDRMSPAGGDPRCRSPYSDLCFGSKPAHWGLCSQIAWLWPLYRTALCILLFFTKDVLKKRGGVLFITAHEEGPQGYSPWEDSCQVSPLGKKESHTSPSLLFYCPFLCPLRNSQPSL